LIESCPVANHCIEFCAGKGCLRLISFGSLARICHIAGMSATLNVRQGFQTFRQIYEASDMLGAERPDSDR
jgi:hypothetical protein